jgi:hypothetical protein
MKRRLFLGQMLMLIASVSGADVVYPKLPLLESIGRADVVVHARINRIEPRTFDSGGRSMKCGTNYFIDVLETYKGPHMAQRSFTFAGEPQGVVNHEVKAGDEMLLLLQPRKAGERPEGGLVDVTQSQPSAAECACLATLSSWTLWFAEAGGFPLVLQPASSTDKSSVQWLGYPRSRTVMPPAVQSLQVPFNRNCKGEECERASRRMVPWLPLRAEILRSLGRTP